MKTVDPAELEKVSLRLKALNARIRVFSELPAVQHTGDIDAFEAAQTARLTEECAILAESLDVMAQMDTLLGSP